MCLCVTAGRATPWNPAQPAAPIHISVSAYMYPVHIVYTPLEPRRRSVESGIMCVCVDIIIMVWFMFIVCFMQPYTCSSFQSSFPFLISPLSLGAIPIPIPILILTPNAPLQLCRPCPCPGCGCACVLWLLFKYCDSVKNKQICIIYFHICLLLGLTVTPSVSPEWVLPWNKLHFPPTNSPAHWQRQLFFPQQSLLVIFPTINKANYALKRGSEGRFI